MVDAGTNFASVVRSFVLGPGLNRITFIFFLKIQNVLLLICCLNLRYSVKLILGYSFLFFSNSHQSPSILYDIFFLFSDVVFNSS